MILVIVTGNSLSNLKCLRDIIFYFNIPVGIHKQLDFSTGY